MRITTPQLLNNIIANLNRNYFSVADNQTRLSTGKRFSKPSEAPHQMAEALSKKVDISEIRQYQRNIQVGRAWLDAGSRFMEQYQQLLQDAYDITLRASNDSNSQVQRETYAKEVRSIRDQIIEISKSKLGGRSIFSGAKTNIEPFDPFYDYQGATNQISWEITRGVKMDMAISGDLAFRVDSTVPYSSTNSILVTLSDLATTLEDPLVDHNMIAAYLPTLRSAEDIAESNITLLASRLERLDILDNSYQDEDLANRKALADIEGLDIAKAMTDLTVSENVYEASLAAAARIGRLSILDFLR